MAPNTLFEIPIYRIANSNNWFKIPVISLSDETFKIQGGRGEPVIFKDEELKANEQGKYLVNIEYLDLKFFLPKIELPTEVEIPLDILEARRYNRKLNAIKRDSTFSTTYQNKTLFFYIEAEQLIIKLFGFDEADKMILEPEKETTADKIEIIHNRKAVNAKKLKLGHPYYELPAEVAQKFETVLKDAELRKLALLPAGISMLDGKEYYKLNVNIPPHMWVKVEKLFQDFGTEGTMTGFLTCKPDEVSQVLKIPAK